MLDHGAKERPRLLATDVVEKGAEEQVASHSGAAPQPARRTALPEPAA